MKKELKDLFKNSEISESQKFNSIKISLASPEKIKSWTYGEIKKPETINYRTFRPEKDGLFCARIFGPIKDYECLCGKYKRMKFRGIICEKCGVEVTKSNVRRERMGHINLATPVAHIWFLKSLPSRISLAIDMKLKEVERVLYFENFIVIEPGLTGLKKNQLLSEDELIKYQNEYGDESFTAGIGAEAILEILKNINLEQEREILVKNINETKSKVSEERSIKRLKLIDSFIKTGNKPEWMILTVVPVIPPELRPLVPLDGGRFATSDLNDLYRRVINRNNRLKRLMDLKAPDIIVRNEKRMLQESVDALFDNGRRGRVITGTGKRPLKSLAEMLKGKQGRFRQNLLGKRVDYSGRSVIVVGPDLKLHECGLPKKMALELFKPFLYARLNKLGLASTIKQAKKLVEKETNAVWDALEVIVREHPVILNRAPTLHRLGVQAFEPKLIEGDAIELHPLTCAAFNADFDGDQMAVHIPLSLEAQLEARVLMMSTNNILSPSNGKPIIVPSQDMILGIYYLSLPPYQEKNIEGYFVNNSEIEQGLESGKIKIHSRIISRFETVDEKGNQVFEKHTSTAGRFLLANLLPKNKDIKFSLIDRVLPKKVVSEIIDFVFRYTGQKSTVIFCDKLKDLGFKHAFKAGISFGKDDLIIPDNKEQLIDETKQLIKDYENQYSEGLITRGEKYNKVVDAWSKCTDKVASEMMKGISATTKSEKGLDINSVFMMADSGARGSAAQMKQLAGMRGLIAKPSGEIIESPITSNFKEGLTALEYFNSTHGARKGLADTALKTANSGYLTRRLCDVAQDLTVTKKDCDCKKPGSINLSEIIEGGNIIVSLSERALGRVAAADVKNPITGDVIIKKGEMINESGCEKIDAAGVKSIKVYSVITCGSKVGVCAMSYGRDLSRGKMVNVGEAIGMISAQSIGEPGTQLTMRTFHVGGTASIKQDSQIVSKSDGVLKIINTNLLEDSKKNLIVMGRNTQLSLEDEKGMQIAVYKVPYGSKLFFKNEDKVKKNSKICEWDPYTTPVIAEKSGIVNFVDLIDGVSLSETLDETTGISSKSVIDWRSQSKNTDLKPRITLRDEKGNVIKKADDNEARYYLVPDSILSVQDGQKIFAGDVIARLPKETSKTKDITGGLPRVAELFEARKAKDSAIIAENNGKVIFGKEVRGKQRVSIVSSNGESSNYLIPKGKHINFNQGEEIKKGEYLLDGQPLPHDILRILGIEELTEYFVNQVQEVYRLQGVIINDKHIETILRQMLKKIEIKTSGDSDLLPGEVIDRFKFDEMNEQLKKDGKKPAIGERVLMGITKASLQTDSFISAASFQETTRVLTDAAIRGKVDTLVGLKENVIVGRLVPAGTGSIKNKWNKKAIDDDQKFIAEQEKIEQTETPVNQ
jgi:DNA-directed RNA polymerase subunit beta'